MEELGNVRRDLLIPLLILGTLGAVLGACTLTFLTIKIAKPFLALALLTMGTVILCKHIFRWKKVPKNQKKKNYSKKTLGLLGLVAGFIDSSAGGGWGPILTPTFIASGSNPRDAVGTVEFTEPLISFVTVITFGLLIGFENFLWSIVLPILIGGIILTPIAAYLCSKIPRRWLGVFVGLWIAILNVRSLILMIL